MNTRLSLVSGAAEPPLLDYTIGAALDLARDRWGDAAALVSAHQGLRWSWSELAARADALAAGLCALGSSRGTGSASGRPTAPNGP